MFFPVEFDSAYKPYFEIVETSPTEIKLCFLVTGYGKDDLTVEIEDGTVWVSGKLNPKDIVAKTLITPSMRFSYRMPKNFIVDTANHENGILTVTLKKIGNKDPVRIEISHTG